MDDEEWFSTERKIVLSVVEIGWIKEVDIYEIVMIIIAFRLYFLSGDPMKTSHWKWL